MADKYGRSNQDQAKDGPLFCQVRDASEVHPADRPREDKRACNGDHDTGRGWYLHIEAILGLCSCSAIRIAVAVANAASGSGGLLVLAEGGSTEEVRGNDGVAEFLYELRVVDAANC